MVVRDANDAVVTKTALKALLDDTTVTYYTVPEGVRMYSCSHLPGDDTFQNGRNLLMVEGLVFTEAEIDAMFPAATFVSITPAEGTTAGGDEVVIVGTNLDGVTSVTFDGAAATELVIVSDTEITCTTPAGSAGTADIVLVDDNANVTESAGFTFVAPGP